MQDVTQENRITYQKEMHLQVRQQGKQLERNTNNDEWLGRTTKKSTDKRIATVMVCPKSRPKSRKLGLGPRMFIETMRAEKVSRRRLNTGRTEAQPAGRWLGGQTIEVIIGQYKIWQSSKQTLDQQLFKEAGFTLWHRDRGWISWTKGAGFDRL